MAGAAGHGLLPTIVMHNGLDGPAEEMRFFGAAAAAERGYNVVSFDGPGPARHRDGLPLRPDWENVVTPVVDWAAGRPGVDPYRIALLGVGMGGYLAARAAAFEHRLAACIAVDGIYDLGVITTSGFPGPRSESEVAPMLRADDYSLGGGVAEKISCPTLICRGGGGHLVLGPAASRCTTTLTCARDADAVLWRRRGRRALP